MKRVALSLVVTGAIGLIMLLSAPPSSSQTDVYRTVGVAASTPADFVYLPLVLNSRAPRPTLAPAPWTNKLHGYATFTRIAALPLEELNDYTNFIYSYHNYQAGVPSEEDLQALRRAGMGVILKLDGRIVEDTFNAAELRRLKAKLDHYKDVVFALCVIDEPYKPEKGYTEDQLRDLVDRVKAIFPEYTMYVNFLAPYYTQMVTGQPWPNIPANIDLISTDIYIHLGEISGTDEYLMRVGRNLDIILDRAGDRPVFYAAPAYGMQDRPSSFPTVEQAQLDYQLYLDYELDGLGWYFHEEQATVAEGVMWGASHFPELLEEHREIGYAILGESPPHPTPTVTPSPANGYEELLVVAVSLSDVAVPCPLEEINEGAFGQIDSIKSTYYESSRGQVDIIGETVSVRLGIAEADVPGCGVADRIALADLADEELVRLGYDLSRYWRRAYVFPVCWGGNIDATSTRVFSSECRKTKILAHEIGHTIGTYHASTPDDEYGDSSCIMGGESSSEKIPPITQFNAPHRVGLGWANVTDIAQTGNYTLIATELENHVILRFEKDASNYYYLSYRVPMGEDSDLGVEYVNRVSVHSLSKNPYGGETSKSILHATLGEGESFTDGRVTVACLSITHEAATVQVTLGN